MPGDRDSDDDVFTSAAKTPARSVAPLERAAPPERGPAERVPGAISSGPFEIDRASLAPAPSGSLPPLPVDDDLASRRSQGMPLSTIVAAGAGIFVVVVALTLLLFR